MSFTVPYISENFVKFVNAGEVEAGNDNFDYAKLDDERFSPAGVLAYRCNFNKDIQDLNMN